MKSIRLIFSDNEGCILPGKGLPFPLENLACLAEFLRKHRSVGFGICTGRSVPYIEAMVQVLDLLDSSIPCICDGGATLYWPQRDSWEIISPPLQREAILEVVTGLDYREEPGKMGCMSLYPNSSTTVDQIYDAVIKTPIADRYNITKSVAAVDINAKGVNKSFGVIEVSRRLGIDLSEILYIGDAHNDIELLRLAGFSACPSNANDEVKGVVDYVASGSSTLGIVEILNHFEEHFLVIA